MLGPRTHGARGAVDTNACSMSVCRLFLFVYKAKGAFAIGDGTEDDDASAWPFHFFFIFRTKAFPAWHSYC